MKTITVIIMALLYAGMMSAQTELATEPTQADSCKGCYGRSPETESVRTLYAAISPSFYTVDPTHAKAIPPVDEKDYVKNLVSEIEKLHRFPEEKTVVVTLYIDKNGEVTEIDFKGRQDKELKEDIINAIKSQDCWKPAYRYYKDASDVVDLHLVFGKKKKYRV